MGIEHRMKDDSDDNSRRKVDLDALIVQMFPRTMFSINDLPEDVQQYIVPVAIRAYAQGFKDAYAKNADNVIINVVRGPTAESMLLELYFKKEQNATQQEGTED